MPVHNAAPFVAEALDSILDQSFRDFELVALDDGCTDRSMDVVRARAAGDPRVRIFDSPSRTGLVHSSQRVVDLSRAPLVARMDADDVARPTRLAAQLAVFETRPDAVLVASLWEGIDAAGRRVRPRDRWAVRPHGGGLVFPHPSVMFRRDAFVAAGGYRAGTEGREDRDLFARMAGVGSVYVITEPLLACRFHPRERSLDDGPDEPDFWRLTYDVSCDIWAGCRPPVGAMARRYRGQLLRRNGVRLGLESIAAACAPRITRAALSTLVRLRDRVAGWQGVPEGDVWRVHHRESVRLGEQFAARVREFVSPGEGCALAGFPTHGNVGDNAIWLGEVAALRDAGSLVTYACDPISYDRDALARSTPEGPILVSGGGSVGDLWPEARALLERILADFPERDVIQLPQSVWWRDDSWAAHFAAVASTHDRFTLLVRDRASEARARSLGLRSVELCPDAAFALAGRLTRWPPTPRHDIVWLLRTDSERAGEPRSVTRPGDAVEDWRAVLEPLSQLYRRAWTPLARRVPPRQQRLLVPMMTVLARARLTAGLRRLHGRVIVTDRLHGHVLATLLDRPTVVLDNCYGKNHAFVEAWTAGWPGVAVATPEDARAAAQRLGGAGRAASCPGGAGPAAAHGARCPPGWRC